MIDLSKGSRINLSKEAPGATKFILGMGWDARKTDGTDFDLDASALLPAALAPNLQTSPLFPWKYRIVLLWIT